MSESDVIDQMLDTWYGDDGWQDISGARQDMQATVRVLLAHMRRYNDPMGNLPISKQPARLATVSQHVRAYAQLIGVWPLTATASPAQEGSPGAGTAQGAGTGPDGGTAT